MQQETDHPRDVHYRHADQCPDYESTEPANQEPIPEPEFGFFAFGIQGFYINSPSAHDPIVGNHHTDSWAEEESIEINECEEQGTGKQEPRECKDGKNANKDYSDH